MLLVCWKISANFWQTICAIGHTPMPLSVFDSTPTTMRKATLLFLIPLFLSSGIFAQTGNPCLRTYEILKTQTATSPEDLVPGAIVFLSQSYLDQLKTGVYSRDASGLRHYDYIRPGTREEIREGLNELASENEILGPDGNVYKATQTAAGVHFFKPKKGFHGNYEPNWKDPYLVIPPGLNPVDVRYSEGVPMQVLEFQPSFLRLRVEEAEWVFFTGYPEIASVFDSEQVRKRLAEKQLMANTLIGTEFMIEINKPVRFLSSLQESASDPEQPIRRMEVVIKEAVVEQNRVLLGYGNPITYLVLDSDTDADFLDLNCIRESILRNLLEDPEALSRSDRELSDLMLRDVPVEEWSQNQELVQALSKRFRLQRDDRFQHGWYEHALLMREEIKRETFLAARLRNDGACFVQSHFASTRGLYHTRIELESRSGVLISSRIPTMDDRSARSRAGSWVTETILFTDEADRRLLQELVDEPDRPILVRYVAGGSYFKEAELSPEYRRIIRDMYLMSELVRYRE